MGAAGGREALSGLSVETSDPSGASAHGSEAGRKPLKAAAAPFASGNRPHLVAPRARWVGAGCLGAGGGGRVLAGLWLSPSPTFPKEEHAGC